MPTLYSLYTVMCSNIFLFLETCIICPYKQIGNKFYGDIGKL